MVQETTETVKLSRETLKLIEQEAEAQGISVDECAEEIVTAFIDYQIGVEVTVKVPKRFLHVIEGENYFGWTKDRFFTSCVKAYISVLISNMTPEEMETLHKKYGFNIDEAARVEIPDCYC